MKLLNIIRKDKKIETIDYEQVFTIHLVAIAIVCIAFTVLNIATKYYLTAGIIASLGFFLLVFIKTFDKKIPLNVRILILGISQMAIILVASAVKGRVHDMITLLTASLAMSAIYFDRRSVLVQGVACNAFLLPGFLLFPHIFFQGTASNFLFYGIISYNTAFTFILIVIGWGRHFIEGAYNKSIEIERQSTVLLDQAATLKNQSSTIIESISYAAKIQQNLLPPASDFAQVFSDHSIIWKPRDIVGGDIYWLKSFTAGSVLCVCDCTGHGTPGALLTVLVSSALEATVNENNCQDTALIMLELERWLISTLNHSSATIFENALSLNVNDGCDLVIMFISNSGQVTMSSANMNVFVCNGVDVTQIKGQKLRIGDGVLTCKEDVITTTIPADSANSFYIASDGLYDQIGQNGKKFGYRTIKNLILAHHNLPQAQISQEIWSSFEKLRGNELMRDDVELITFKPRMR